MNFFRFRIYRISNISKPKCVSGDSGSGFLLPPTSEGWGKVIFSVCVSIHTSTGGGGVPPSQVQVGGTPSQVQVGGGVPPSQVQVGGGVGAYPLPRSRWGAGVGWGTPFPGPMGGAGAVGGRVPPIQVRSQDEVGGGTPYRHSVYLLRGGRYASCIHAGELYCSNNFFRQISKKFKPKCVSGDSEQSTFFGPKFFSRKNKSSKFIRFLQYFNHEILSNLGIPPHKSSTELFLCPSHPIQVIELSVSVSMQLSHLSRYEAIFLSIRLPLSFISHQAIYLAICITE